jgi:hypothetical protein
MMTAFVGNEQEGTLMYLWPRTLSQGRGISNSPFTGTFGAGR